MTKIIDLTIVSLFSFLFLIPFAIAANYGQGRYGLDLYTIGEETQQQGGGGAGGGGAGGGGAGGGGAGGGGIVGAVLQVIKDFSLYPEVMKIELVQGETKSSTLQIRNTGNTKLKFFVEVRNLEDYIAINDDSFELEPEESHIVILVFRADENNAQNVYTGKINVKADGLEKEIIALIEVKAKKPLFDMKINVDENYKKVLRGQEVKFNVELTNKGILKPVDVELFYSIKDFDDNVLLLKTETLAVEDELSVRRNFRIPLDFKLGKYTVYGRVEYDNQVTASSDIFEVVDILQTIEVKVAEYNYILLFIIVTLLLVLAQILWTKRKPKEKETVKIEVKVAQVPEKVLTEEFFPPCINLILNGLEDGRKRALKILLSYFKSIGLGYDELESRAKEWNTKNKEPLSEKYLVRKLRHLKQTEKVHICPNCPKRQNNVLLPSQQNLYTDIRVCKPDNFCAKIKNPSKYGKIKSTVEKQAKTESVIKKLGINTKLQFLRIFNPKKAKKFEFELMEKGLLEAVMKKEPLYPNKRIYKKIKKLGKQGYDIIEIRKKLIDKGYDLMDIDYAIETYERRKR